MTMQGHLFEHQFHADLTKLLNTFYNLLLLYNQDIQVVNFSQVDLRIVHMIIFYNTLEGQSVKLEAFDKFGPNYSEILEFVWEACKTAILETRVDLAEPFIPLAFPSP